MFAFTPLVRDHKKIIDRSSTPHSRCTATSPCCSPNHRYNTDSTSPVMRSHHSSGGSSMGGGGSGDDLLDGEGPFTNRGTHSASVREGTMSFPEVGQLLTPAQSEKGEGGDYLPASAFLSMGAVGATCGDEFVEDEGEWGSHSVMAPPVKTLGGVKPTSKSQRAMLGGGRTSLESVPEK
eukprot:GHVN01073130.1.p1 GENE.GHVN01073130.1~~GHVN01073130.1.p1  ORF type:complete len:179 (+),score=35.78 GHVN01073130.1:81-617(+)